MCNTDPTPDPVWVERFATALYIRCGGRVDMDTLRRRGRKVWEARQDDAPEKAARDEWDKERPDLDSS